MKRNMGTFDRLLRAFIVAPALTALSVAVLGAGSAFGILALVFAGVMLITAAVGFCPPYTLFGLSTKGGVFIRGRQRLGGRPRVVAQH